MFRASSLRQTDRALFDPAIGASRIGYREISGYIPATGDRVSLTAWAIVFSDDTQATERYEQIVGLLGDVGADGLIRQSIDGVPGERFGNMSERSDLFGDFTTIWVTSNEGSGEEHGAVLVSVGGPLVQILATDLYAAQGQARAVYVIEAVARRMVARERDMLLPPESDTMSRLPILVDLYELFENASIGTNRYSSRP